MIILSTLPFKSQFMSKIPSLRFTLNRLPVDKPQLQTDEEDLPADIGKIADAENQESNEASVASMEQESPGRSPSASLPRSPTTTGYSLFFKAIEAIRNNTLPKLPAYKTFSTQDFPKREGVNPFQAVKYLPVLISQPRQIESTDVHGYTTILRTNGFGKVVCVQERGFAGDLNPPLFYIIPAATCGHLLPKD